MSKQDHLFFPETEPSNFYLRVSSLILPNLICHISVLLVILSSSPVYPSHAVSPYLRSRCHRVVISTSSRSLPLPSCTAEVAAPQSARWSSDNLRRGDAIRSDRSNRRRGPRLPRHLAGEEGEGRAGRWGGGVGCKSRKVSWHYSSLLRWFTRAYRTALPPSPILAILVSPTVHTHALE